jgi:hypothetical protein
MWEGRLPHARTYSAEIKATKGRIIEEVQALHARLLLSGVSSCRRHETRSRRHVSRGPGRGLGARECGQGYGEDNLVRER